MFEVKLYFASLEYNPGSLSPTQWVVFEDREKDASLMNFDIDPYQTGYIKH